VFEKNLKGHFEIYFDDHKNHKSRRGCDCFQIFLSQAQNDELQISAIYQNISAQDKFEVFKSYI